MLQFHRGTIALAATTGLALTSVAAGDVLVVIDRVSTGPGTTALVGVSLVSDDPTGDTISGFNLPTDFNLDGFNDTDNDGIGELPAPFSLNATPLVNALYTNTGLDMPQTGVLPLISADAIATGSGPDVAIGLTPVKLYDLVIDVDASAVVGDVLPISIFQPGDPFGALFNIAGGATVSGPTDGTPVFGSVTVTPEPATAMTALAAVGLLLGRRRIAR